MNDKIIESDDFAFNVIDRMKVLSNRAFEKQIKQIDDYLSTTTVTDVEDDELIQMYFTYVVSMQYLKVCFKNNCKSGYDMSKEMLDELQRRGYIIIKNSVFKDI